MDRRVETILEEFINNEIAATDQRIAAIHTFVETLRAELAAHAARVPEDAADKKYIMMVLKLFKEMIQTYDEEVIVLTTKRSKMLDHLLSARSVTTYLNPNTEQQNNLHIN
ncbi:MAG: hypothetical protein LBV04_10475 [Deferribacteraceae bacterium]|jgi:hypothetical protein|nr:hypothetical protein [Deferribacteraceae bacterium]